MVHVAEVDAATLEAELLAFVREGIARRSGRNPEQIDPNTSFVALGLDSVQLLELGAQVTDRFGVALEDFAAYDHPTPAELARHVASVAARGPALTPNTTRGDPPEEAATAEPGMKLPSWPVKTKD